MQLRMYWQLIRKRLWLVLGLPLVVGLSYPLVTTPPPPSYAAGMRFVVGVRPETTAADQYTYDRYYTWLTAEYLVDDLSEVVKSRRFAEDVGRLAQLEVPPGAIQGATSAGKLHRVLSVTVTWPDPDELAAIATAVQDILTHHADAYFAQLGTESAEVAIIDPPSVYPVAPSLREQLDLPLRIGLALAAGIALAFFLDYVDDTVRGPGDLAALGLEVMAIIPGRSGLRATLGRRRRLP